MLAAVVPARNEESQIGLVLSQLVQLPFDWVIPVVNGCTDRTMDVCRLMLSPIITPVYFREPLGVDVPRAVGAHLALMLGAGGVVFVDGDMTGSIRGALADLVTALRSGVDCALTNCYPYIHTRHPLAKEVLRYREILNRKLCLFQDLGLATPSHGPHGVSRRLLTTIPVEDLAVPPVELARAAAHGLNVKVSAAIPHQELKSKERSLLHTTLMAQTIIGDCIEGISLANGISRHRRENGISYDGFHSARRFDLLRAFAASLGSPGPLP